MPQESKPYELLQKHLNDGTVFIEGNSYIGKASDGVEVELGNVGDELTVEAYLDAHPTPKDW